MGVESWGLGRRSCPRVGVGSLEIINSTQSILSSILGTAAGAHTASVASPWWAFCSSSLCWCCSGAVVSNGYKTPIGNPCSVWILASP